MTIYVYTIYFANVFLLVYCLMRSRIDLGYKTHLAVQAATASGPGWNFELPHDVSGDLVALGFLHWWTRTHPFASTALGICGGLRFGLRRLLLLIICQACALGVWKAEMLKKSFAMQVSRGNKKLKSVYIRYHFKLQYTYDIHNIFM